MNRELLISRNQTGKHRLHSKKFLMLSALSLLLLMGFASIVNAADPFEPTYGTATVDGNIGEWDLTQDYFADMYRAFKDSKPVEAKAYLRYDMNTHTMYVLVLTEPGVPGLLSESDAWAAINATGNKVFFGDSGNDGVPPDFAWVGIGYDGDSSHVQGYEASFILEPGTHTMKMHIEVYDDGEAQTSGLVKAGLDLFVVPETPIATTIVAVMLAGVVFAAYKKYH
ncbi:MAG: hypothetical protein NWF04_04435 [Candidatus Bathyarchaeota archaeon]|nr:hypothetical protein [Candidatus Bathyarchaeota archaeon]